MGTLRPMTRPRLATVLPILAGVTIGLATGLAAYTFVYARGYSYLLDDPAACANCHVMNPQMDSWVKSSHHAVATCNDCHTPKGAVGKYATKALNGWNHSLAFTTGDFDEPIRATYPWANGLKADEIDDYYQQEGFRDWVHAESGAPVLRRSTRSSRCGARAPTRGPAWCAPTATCPTGGPAASSSATTT